MVKFSIAIPAYKGVFFNECLNSLLQQTYSDFEIIIVDDASPDNLFQIVENNQDIPGENCVWKVANALAYQLLAIA